MNRDMLIVLGVMFAGILTGYLLRKRNLGGVSRLIVVLIWLLLFLLGTEVGGNHRIVEGLHTIGLEALAVTAAALAGSVLAAWALWRILHRRKKEQKA